MNSYFVSIFGERVGPLMGLAAIIVIIAITLWLALLLLRRFRSGLFISGGNKNRLPRLAVTDAVPVDSHRRIILVRRDDVEHLIMIGGPTDIVIETGISKSPAIAQQQPVLASTPRLPAQPIRNAQLPVEAPLPPQQRLEQRPANLAARDAVIEAERGRPVRGNENSISDRRLEPVLPNNSSVPSVGTPTPQMAPVPPVVAAQQTGGQSQIGTAENAGLRNPPVLDIDSLIKDLRLNPAKDR